MSAYRTLNRTVLAKVESPSGTDASPTVGSNAVLTENPVLNLDLNSIETNESTGSLDDRGPIPAGGTATFECTVYPHHSGTAETPPEYAPFLKACGMAETITGAAVTGTSQAIAAGSITLASGASATNDYYAGMPVTANPDGGGNQTRIIKAYNGTSKLATLSENWSGTPSGTPSYTIPKNVKYAPTSASLPTITIYLYMHRSDAGDSRLMKLVGAAGNFRLELGARAAGGFRFSFQGQLVAPSDVSAPSAPTLQSTRPYPWLDAHVRLGGVEVKMADLSIDAGNAVQLVDNPNTTFGYDSAGITRRRTGGEFRLPKDLLSVADPFTQWLNSTEQALTSWWGSTAGAKLALTIPAIRYTAVADEDRSGFDYQRLPWRSIGENKGLILCYH